MEHNIVTRAAELLKKNSRRKRWHRALTAMAAVVVFTTSYMMILPAITLSADQPQCGMEEHTHTESCYETQLVCGLEENDSTHTHGEGCYTQQQKMSCTLTEGEGHTHSDSCYGNVCGLEETAGHTHTDECHTQVPTKVLTCSEAESAGHTHGDGCYDESGTLVCTETESAGHTHGDSCYTESYTFQLNCGQQEAAAHTHSDSCTGLICGQTEQEAHTHSDACYTTENVLTCTEAEGHVHSDACYEQVLVCQVPEHTHTDACYPAEEPQEPELTCTVPEHAHEENCYDADGNVICGMEEHTHTDECYGEVVEIPEEETPLGAFPEEVPEGYVEYEFQNEEGLTVRAMAPENAFGEDVELYAEILAEDSEEYAQAQENLNNAENVPEYTGMAAMDIRFVAAGSEEPETAEEIEPDASMGPVYVQIDAQALLPEDVDESTLAVQHHVETTDGGLFGTGLFADTEITVETVADSSTETGEVTAMLSDVTAEAVPLAAEPAEEQTEDAAEDAAPAAMMDMEAKFGVESFSTFTITWNAGGSRPLEDPSDAFKVTTYLYQDGEITSEPLDDQFNVEDLILGTGNELRFNEENPLLAIEGYRLMQADIQWTEWKWESSGWIGGDWKPTTDSRAEIQSFTATYDWSRNTWSYSYVDSNGDSQSITWRAERPWSDEYMDTEISFSLYYEKLVPEATGELQIADTIGENGSLRADYTPLDPENSLNLSSGYYYKWYRVDGDSRTELSGKLGDTIEVYYDGARNTYQVELWSLEDQEEPVLISNPYQIPYYSQLQNGSFENPVIPDDSNQQFTNGLFPELIWQTTGVGTGNKEGQDIEIVRPGRNQQSNYGTNTAADGKQFAELNCEAPGALYQDVLTIPGAELNWWASHRGRTTGGSNNTMYVVIMEASEAAEHVTTQEQINQIAAAAEAKHIQQMTANLSTAQNKGVSVTVNMDGEWITATVWKVSSDTRNWYRYYDTYTVPEGQYLTRFFFAAEGGSTLGNLLDNVGFGQAAPPPVDGKASLTIQKTVTGLSEGATVPAESFTFDIYNDDGQIVQQISLPSTAQTVSSGQTVIRFTETVTGLDYDVYEVKETLSSEGLSGYQYVSTSNAVGTAASVQGLDTERFALTDTQTSISVDYTNAYECLTGDLSITKSVWRTDSNAPSYEGEFQFEITVPEANGQFTAVYTTADTEDGRVHNGSVTFKNGTATISLYAGETVTIQKLPTGKQATITEINFDGYSPAWSNSENTATDIASTAGGTVTTKAISSNDPIKVTCTNTTGAVLPSTGGPGVGLYLTLGSTLTFGAGLLLFLRRRKEGGNAV